MKKKAVVRRPKFGLAGCPTDEFFMLKRYFHEDLDGKVYSNIIKSYITKYLSSEDSKICLLNPEYYFTTYSHIAATMYWKDILQKEFPDNWDGERCINQFIDKLILSGNGIVEVKASTNSKPVLSPAQRLEAKINETIMYDYDTMIDEWISGDKSDIDIYQKMKEYDLKGKAVPSIKRIIERDLELYKDSYNKTEEQAIEAFEHIGRREQKRRINVLEKMVSDLDSVQTMNKAVRKPRATKAKPVTKLVSSLKYKKECNEYKIASITPESIVGSSRLYTFNTKYGELTEFVSISTSGIQVKGTSITNFDPEQSRTTKLRKPQEFLSIVLKKTSNQISKEWDKLTTKTYKAGSRCNENTILLRKID